MSADALIGDVPSKRDQLDDPAERHRCFVEHFEKYPEPSGYVEIPSWHLKPGWPDVERGLKEIANHSDRRPWSAYDQLVLERARDFDLLRFLSPTATADILGPASDELPDWWELEPDSERLEAFRAELVAQGVDAVFAKWKGYVTKKANALADADDAANKALAASRARLLYSYQRAVLKTTGSDDLFCLDRRSTHVRIAVSWSTSSRQLQRRVPGEFTLRLRAAEDRRFREWLAANPVVKVEFSELDRATLREAKNAQRSDLPIWKPKTERQTNREREPYRKKRSGDPGYNPKAGYRAGDVAELNFRGVPGMRREPLMSLEDERALCTWQLANGVGTTAAVTPIEELFAEAQAIGFYVGGEKPGSKGLFAAIEEEWNEAREEKASGCRKHGHEKWWRGSAMHLLMCRRASSPREAVIRSVMQARGRLRDRRRTHPLKNMPLFWPLDDVFEKGLTLREVAELRWPEDRKDNALVKTVRSFRAALRDLKAANTTSCTDRK
ncbi:hypothetical protein [Hyphomicrobium sp. CS1GBMeth3]|uniref:hypothetical protein n=1 Tax=Hyphomicrobium sp. CS1GBMeth3 TaxID=1892845 RepID=UPI000AF054ED|nr:hypothetical protein [Hyphomicrobium sp. CS1GBMeth3]